jgi:hypothetical protein
MSKVYCSSSNLLPEYVITFFMTSTVIQIIKVPYENYRKVFRASQRNVERELGAVHSASTDLANRAESGNVDNEEVLKAIDTMIGRVENLKRKVCGFLPICVIRILCFGISFRTCKKQQGSLPRMSCVNACTILPKLRLYQRLACQNLRGGQIQGSTGGL